MDRKVLDSDDFYQRLSDVVGEAVEQAAHLDTSWTKQEMTKRIVKYIMSPLKQEDQFREAVYPEVSNKYVQWAMSSYQAACKEKQWFFDVDLVNALSCVASELYRALGMRRVKSDDLERAVREAFEGELDQVMVERALWDVCQETFGADSSSQKVYNAMWRSYQPAMVKCKDDSRPTTDREKAESFLKEWIESSMDKAWGALQHTNDLSEKNMMTLWRKVVYPFGGHCGDDSARFTTVPRQLLKHPLEGNFTPFVDQVIRNLVRNWEHQQSGRAQHSKRRKGSQAYQSWEAKEEETHREEQQQPPSGKSKDLRKEEPEEEPDVKDYDGDDQNPDEDQEYGAEVEDSERHPDCTSAEECVGRSSDRLVRHIIKDQDGNDMDGDAYCESCWRCFLQDRERGFRLVGHWEDDGTQFELPEED
mmetsp:Transcript_17785/g.41441  ORF Transcript_17785/g.41441 Transcript_17785/m.41441 type:complete len:419 (+) Transcript_17785:55-1311(+)